MVIHGEAQQALRDKRLRLECGGGVRLGSFAELGDRGLRSREIARCQRDGDLHREETGAGKRLLRGAEIAPDAGRRRLDVSLFQEVADPKLDPLARVPLFSRLGKRELEFLSSRVDEISLKPGQTVIRQGQATESFFILVSGNVQVTREGKPAARLGPGDFFGEIGMLDHGPATATVVTDGAVEAMVLSHAQFRDAIKGNDALAMQVIAAMAERLRANALA